MGKNACSAALNRGTSQYGVKALEFYSGLGGMHFSCELAHKLGYIPAVEVLAAFDINPVANAIYEHNFGHIVRRNNIEAVPLKQIDEYGAQLWMLAPPCQPYTRQGLRKDINDARAKSFVALLAKIPDMKSPPIMILIENVVGFESSATQQALAEVLQECGYHFQDFLLSPTSFGTPYSRPRYFGVVRKQPFGVQKRFPTPWTCRPQTILDALAQGQIELTSSPQDRVERRCIKDYLEATPSDTVELPAHGSAAIDIVESFDNAATHPEASAAAAPCLYSPTCASNVSNAELPIHSQLQPALLSNCVHASTHITEREDGVSGQAGDAEPSADVWAPFRVERQALDKCCHCIDIVTEDMHDANCFTKAYSRYVKGTGSVLATQNLSILDSFPDWGHREEGCRPWYGPEDQRCSSTDEQPPDAHKLAEAMWDLQLRYFSPREVANLHSFPPHFSFPADVTFRQRYACLGNSLSVEVVAALLHYLFHGVTYFAQ